jgi:hypothetical protein
MDGATTTPKVTLAHLVTTRTWRADQRSHCAMLAKDDLPPDAPEELRMSQQLYRWSSDRHRSERALMFQALVDRL